jgi:hypothetical protein
VNLGKEAVRCHDQTRWKLSGSLVMRISDKVRGKTSWNKILCTQKIVEKVIICTFTLEHHKFQWKKEKNLLFGCFCHLVCLGNERRDCPPCYILLICFVNIGFKWIQNRYKKYKIQVKYTKCNNFKNASSETFIRQFRNLNNTYKQPIQCYNLNKVHSA